VAGDQWDRIDDLQAMPMDEGDGLASVELDKATTAVVEKLALRTASDANVDAETGADLGAGPGAGLITGENIGGAKDINDAEKMAEAL
jgi:Mn-containing catalase